LHIDIRLDYLIYMKINAREMDDKVINEP
jgi:hypothetical protein